MDGTRSDPPPTVSTAELIDQITELAGHLNAGTYRWLMLIAEFDRRLGWNCGLTKSCAHWLNWKCGIDLGAAREKVRVAHALESLPLISAAMARGELSYSKVRALTRVACAGTEAELLSMALHGTASHVEKLVRRFRHVLEVAELSREARQYRNRSLSWRYDEDGSIVIKARLPAETGGIVMKALDAALEQLPLPDVSAETYPAPKPEWAHRRADALAVLAESYLAHGPSALTGGERQQIVVHVDANTLEERTAGRCEFEEGPSIAAETARRLACDASVVRIVEDERGDPLDVGRRTRSIPPALRRALNSRDQGCCFPGCTQTRYVDGHHIKHWAEGGETKLANLVSLCRFHHRQVHEGGITVQRLDDGAWRFTRKVGPFTHSFDSVAPGHSAVLGDWRQLLAAHHEQGLAIGAQTAATRWRGETMDYGQAMMVLVQRAEAAGTFPRKRATPPAGQAAAANTAI
jgi:Domain of unknown function (DUF222)/HNH endonuclease